MQKDLVLTDEQAAPFRAHITRKYCTDPRHKKPVDISKLPIQAFPHSDGWTVKGISEKMWLYIRCPDCRYDWSLWKLGVPRDFSNP